MNTDQFFVMSKNTLTFYTIIKSLKILNTDGEEHSDEIHTCERVSSVDFLT